MKRKKLSPRRAVWLGLLGTPVLIVAAVVVLGVASAPAGPSKTTAAPGPVAQSPDTAPVGAPQDAKSVQAYWTPARMAAAQAKPIPTIAETAKAAGDSTSVARPTGPPLTADGYAPASTRGSGESLPASPANLSTDPLSVPYHTTNPYTRYSFMGTYSRYPASTVAKMFFSQDADGNGVGENYVCSASSIQQDAVWTAGHCVNNALNGAGLAGGWSYNVLICPSYDNGVNPAIGCWTGPQLWTLTAYRASGGGNQDMGIINTADNGTVLTGKIGTRTGWLGWAVNFSRNQNWTALGYPQGSPFNGNKLILATSTYGYDDNWTPGVASVSMGSDLTGGSSGGPWVILWGFSGQIGGKGNNYLNGHNDWRHTAFPNEMNSPYFDCRFILLLNAATGSNIAC